MSVNILRKGFMAMALTACLASPGHAAKVYTFGPDNSHLQGWINYTLIGRYVASFTGYKGRIWMDSDSNTIKKVELDIDVSTVKSKYPVLDKIVRSQRLLYADKYPYIRFESDNIKMSDSGNSVSGVLKVRGITKEYTFPFSVTKQPNQVYHFSGDWAVNRKDFDIIWNDVLDKGGIIVGNHLHVEWQVALRY